MADTRSNDVSRAERARADALAQVTELLDRVAASGAGLRGVCREAAALTDELRRRTAGWMLTQDAVVAAAPQIWRVLGGIADEDPGPARAGWAYVGIGERVVVFIVWWPRPGNSLPSYVRQRLTRELADILGVAVDGVTLLTLRELAIPVRSIIVDDGVRIDPVVCDAARPESAPARVRTPLDPDWDDAVAVPIGD